MWFWFAGLVIGLCLVLALPGWFYRPDVWANQNSADQLAGALDRGHEMEQTFTAGRDGLFRLPPHRGRAECVSAAARDRLHLPGPLPRFPIRRSACPGGLRKSL